MDAREFAFWLRQAHILRLEEQLMLLRVFRTAMHADRGQYARMERDLERALSMVVAGVSEAELYESSWEELQQIGGQ